MDSLSAILALLVTLSLATERVTEAIKGFPVLSLVLAKERAGSWEEARKAAIHIIAILVGTAFAYSARTSISSLLKLPTPSNEIIGLPLLFGALASGGSGIWNSTLDLVRTIKQQKAALLQQADPKAEAQATPAVTPHGTSGDAAATKLPQ